jgi:NitT/TauT family transport system permease protein/sulfonate transport system permease protein
MKARFSNTLANGVVLLALLAWYLWAQTLPEYVLPGPQAVALRLYALFTDPQFLGHTLASTLRILLAVVLALVARAWPSLDGIVSGVLQPFFNAFPSIGWAILAAIWFPPGHFAIVFVQLAILIPFCLISIGEGLRQIDREMLEMATSFTRSRTRLVLHVGLPLMLPYVMGALRIAYGVAWKIALVAELMGSTSGLGFLMLRAQGSADITTVVAACLAIVLLFYAGEKLLIDPLARRFAAK